MSDVLCGLYEYSQRPVHVISHTESFAYYVLSQRKELWSNQVGLFELSEDRLCYYEMKVQRGMRRNMVQAEARIRRKPLIWISWLLLLDVTGRSDPLLLRRKNYWRKSCFLQYSLREKDLNVRTGPPVL